MNGFILEALAEHLRLVEYLRANCGVIEAIARRVGDAIAAGHRVYLIGNGGSAADAQHIAAELLGRFKLERAALPAIALTTDTSTLTSVGNDYGFGQVFTRQVQGLVRAGDVLWALSTSGNSENIIDAVRLAREAGAIIVGMTGRTGGKLRPLCHECLCVDHESSDRIQEIHQVAYHLICEAVERRFAASAQPA